MKLIEPDSVKAALDAESNARLRERKRLLYQHLSAATNREQLLTLLRTNLATEPEMLSFLDQITGAAPATFDRNYPADAENPLLSTAVKFAASKIPPLEIQSTPPDKPNIFARGRRHAKPKKTQEPNT